MQPIDVSRRPWFFALLWLVASAGLAAAPPDYTRKRLEFAAAPEYDAYTLQILVYGALDEHRALVAEPDKSVSDLNAPLQRAYKAYPLGVQVNRAIAGFLEYTAGLPGEVGDEDRSRLRELADVRRATAAGVLQSILESGTGQDPDNAFVVINLMEEFAVMDAKGIESWSQALFHQSERRVYDVLSGTDSGGVSHVVYFDINSFYWTSDSDVRASHNRAYGVSQTRAEKSRVQGGEVR